jgi:hypothetical protein
MRRTDTSKTSTSLSASIMNKVATFHLRLGERVTCSFRTARMEVGRAVQDAARIIRIMTSLHSAKDFQSVLRLYGIEDSGECQSPNEM